MQRHRGARVVLRRETLATRRLRARLCRERQGPDGKWETNKKKREVRIVKCKCPKIQNMFDAMRTKQNEEEAAAFPIAEELIAEFRSVQKAADFRKLLHRAEALAVSVGLLRQEPSILESLRVAAKRCRKNKDDALLQLVDAWECVLQKQSQREKAAAKPHRRVVAKRSVDKLGTDLSLAGRADSRRMETIVHAPAASRRFTKAKPNWKLGKLFASMRTRSALVEEADAKTATALALRLHCCANAGKFKELLPELQKLTMTQGILGKPLSILDSLKVAAKRCRQSKTEAVTELISAWSTLSPRQLSKRCADQGHDGSLLQNQETPHKIIDKVAEGARKNTKSPSSQTDTAVKHSMSSLARPLKQRRITAFFQ